MLTFHLPTFAKPSEEVGEKVRSTICMSCFVTWGSIGLVVVVTLVLKLVGLI